MKYVRKLDIIYDMKGSITERIKESIRRNPKGIPFTTAKFLGMGSRASVDQALCRLTKSGFIKRLSRGVYIRPKESPYVGEVMPSPRTVAERVAKQKGYRIQTSGAEAARKFGLTTQMPVQPIFWTNGPSKTFKVGNTTVKLKHVSERKLGPENSKTGEAIVALWYLGKNSVNKSVLETIGKQLSEEERKELLKSAALVPAWMYEKIRHAPWAQSNV